MNRLSQAALVCALRDALEERGSWCGETHLQKAAYILQEAAGVPLGVEFVLYKHGPFSFDLRDTLTAMRVLGLVHPEPQPYPYGPKLKAGPRSQKLEERHASLVTRVRPHLDAVADLVDVKGVAALERLATALLLIRRSPDDSDDALAAQLQEIKPHITLADARDAIREMRAFLDQTSQERPFTTL